MPVKDHQSMSVSGADPAAFRKRGYTIVKGLFEAEEVAQLREQVIVAFAEMERQGRVGVDPGSEGTIRGIDGDLLSVPSLRHVLLDQRVLRAIGELLGGEPAYFGDSSVRIGGNGVRRWHRDNVNRTRRRGPDWQSSYPLIRCGLYLQDHSQHSGGLALRPHSHETRRRLPTLPRYVESKAGELVAWNMRTVHVGEVVRMRGVPRLPLNPRVQSRLPAVMRVSEDGDRVVLFMAFGLPGSHLDNYVGYLRTRHYMQRSWSRSRFGPEVWEEAETSGLHVLRPIPTYGTPVDRFPRDVLARGARGKRESAVPPPEQRHRSDRGGSEDDLLVDVLKAIREHPAVVGMALTGYSLVDFAGPRLEEEVALLLRGWTLAHAAGAGEEDQVLLDAASSPALLMGARAGFGLDPGEVDYAIAPAISGSPLKRAIARQSMRGIAAFSNPEHVRVAAVTTGDLARALATLSATGLRSVNLGVLPFPGMDDGGGQLFALRYRLPLLTAYGPRKPGPGVAVRLPERLGLGVLPALDRALTMLLKRLLVDVAPEQDQAVRALGGLHRTHGLRAFLLPDMASSASRLLMAYARDRGKRVGVLRPSTYELCEPDEADKLGVALAGSESRAEAERVQDWPAGFDANRFAEALNAIAE